MRAPAPLVGVRAAFVFLTRLPFGGFPYEDRHLAWAPAHFPLVGAVVGLLSGLLLVLTPACGPWVAGTLTVLASIYVTGAFHEDGLADTADALGGTHEREKLLEIMKDSRIGTYGACALSFSLLLRAMLLAELATFSLKTAFSVWVLTQGLSRTGPVVLMATLPYVAGRDAKNSSFAQGGTRSRAVVALSWALVFVSAAVLLSFPPALLAAWVVALVAVTGLLGRTFLRRMGGYTGDFLGATEQVSEIVLLFLALVALRAPSPF